MKFKFQFKDNFTEFLEVNLYKFLAIFFNILIIVLLSNKLDKIELSEYSKIYLWCNIFLLISSSGLNLFFFQQFNNKEKIRQLINFLTLDYVIINLLIFIFLFITELKYFFFGFEINIFLFFLFFNSSFTLILLSLISKKNIGINKTTIFENLLKNFLFFSVIFYIFFINIKYIDNYNIIVGYTISCYLLSLILFIKNFSFLKYIYSIKNNKKFFNYFKIFYSIRIKQSILSFLNTIQMNLPIIFFSYYKMNLLIADYHIVLILIMFLRYVNANIDINIFDKFLKNNKNIKKLVNIVGDSYIISLPYVLILSVSIFVFWNFINLYIFDSKFYFNKITLILILLLFYSNFIFGFNHLFYISVTKNINKYLFLCFILIIVSSFLFIYFFENLSLNLSIAFMILASLLRNLWLHFYLKSIKIDVSIFNKNIIYYLSSKIFNLIKKI